MNTQKMNTQKKKQLSNSKKNSGNNENTWNSIKDLIKIRKTEKLLKFEEKFSEVIHTISKKSESLQVEPMHKTIITKVPQNIESGQTFQLFIDGKYMKIKCPVEGKKISFKTQNTRNIYKEIQDLVNIRIAYKIMYKMGKYYGYPKCCINDFVLRTHNEQEIDSIQELAGRYTGYVPCVNCSEKIVSNKLSIEKLIKDRKCNTKFPYDDEHGHIIPCKKHARLIFLKKITMYQAINSGCKDCYASDDDSDEDELDGNECCMACKI
jgi:hypothetical protein